MINEVDIQTFLAPLPTLHLGILMSGYVQNSHDEKLSEASRRANWFYAECVKRAIEAKDGGWSDGYIHVRGMVKTCKMIADFIHNGKLIANSGKLIGTYVQQ